VKLLVDMNLSPDWVPQLRDHGWEGRHWSDLGSPTAADIELLEWARANDHVVLTQDLDFSYLLFVAETKGPSVILLRLDNEFDAAARQHVFAAIRETQNALAAGALLTITEKRVRMRRLPIRGET
jgi:predicted nuclease of predicted toxin-antitoxin system